MRCSSRRPGASEPGRACSGFLIEHNGFRAEAARAYRGPVLLADEGMVVDVP